MEIIAYCETHTKYFTVGESKRIFSFMWKFVLRKGSKNVDTDKIIRLKLKMFKLLCWILPKLDRYSGSFAGAQADLGVAQASFSTLLSGTSGIKNENTSGGASEKLT